MRDGREYFLDGVKYLYARASPAALLVFGMNQRACLVLSFLLASAASVSAIAAQNVTAGGSNSARLTALAEHLRPDPFGGIVAPDRKAGNAPASAIVVTTARKGYASCHVVVNLPKPGAYRLEAKPFEPANGIEISVSREWFHYVPSASQYFPDALIPISLPYESALPDVQNRVPNQTAQAFWVDFWIPENVAPGEYLTVFTLRSASNLTSLPTRLRVLKATVPDQDVVTIDHNSYGTSWFLEQYPHLTQKSGADFFDSPAEDELIQAYHRIFYEHRGVFHQLGYGHAGKVSPEFAPALEGTGRSKHVVDWTRFDKHYGPLLDGSAFAGTHRGAKPIPFVYLPINPEWPASYEFWGEPGYEREFVNVVSEMERHFRKNGWTHTNFELFFNHKQRYKGFDWDGDEQRFSGDYAYLREYGRLLRLALPTDSPVHFVFRADVSWTMERQWKELAGVINFWVCGGGMLSWYPGAPAMLKKRGDIVWTYGGTPDITEPSSHITLDVLRPWIQQVDGFVRWLVTSPGADPWFQLEGGREALVYPGDRFGIAGPVPSIRLRLERNAVQDLTLLDSLAGREGRDDAAHMRERAAHSFNGTEVAAWWTPRPALADTNPEEWSNADIDDATPADPRFGRSLDSAAWQRVRTMLYDQVR